MDEVEILLVEDNPADVELALRALKKNNIANKVEVVNDGEEALDFLYARGSYINRVGARLPKVILLDLKLPKINGLEVLTEIKSNPKTQMVPVVVLTSSKEENDIIKSYKLGVNSYIVKPVDFDKFLLSVKEIGMYWLLINQPPNL
ncbi:MAG: response regulator [Perlabentimonas sp.]